MGDFLGDLKKGINKSVEDLNKSVKTLEIQSKISSLKKEADTVYAEIGKRAVQENGLEKYTCSSGKWSGKIRRTRRQAAGTLN